MAQCPSHGGPVNQLTLPLVACDGPTFANFVVGANSELIGRLMGREVGSLWLWGGPSTGKSHLACATCHWHVDRGAKVAYVPLSAVPRGSEIVHGLSTYDLVVLDDLPQWLGHLPLEQALFGLYEGLRANGGHLVMMADRPPLQCGFVLPDIGSRLKAASVGVIDELDDHGKGLVLANRARNKGFELSAKVLDFWLNRSEPRLSRLLDDLERLEQAALSERRRFTIPLVKAVLGL